MVKKKMLALSYKEYLGDNCTLCELTYYYKVFAPKICCCNHDMNSVL